MSEPIVLITHSRLKEDKLDGLRQYFRQSIPSLEQAKPGTVAFLPYLSDDGTELTIVHVFPDAESMALHMQGVQERARAAYEFIESKAFEIYGPALEEIVETMRATGTSGVTLTVHREYVGGFLRLKPDDGP